MKKLLPEDNTIVAAAKQQFDLYFKLSVQYEKQKSVVTRAIGDNKHKVDPRFLQMIAQARRQKDLAESEEKAKQAAAASGESEEVKNTEMAEQTKQAAEAFQRYQGLVKKLQDPKKKRDILDVLEY